MSFIKIHMLDVGKADSIIVELADAFGNTTTLLIDGGKKENSKKIISYFNEMKKFPECIICTHLDRDHVGGLSSIVEEFKEKIRCIWTHVPARHNKTLKSALYEKIKVDGRSRIIFSSIEDLEGFVNIAEKYGIPIFEPFSDYSDEKIKKFCSVFGIRILSPSREFYNGLLEKMKEDFGIISSRSIRDAIEYVSAATSDPCSVIGIDGADTPENESSVVFEINIFAKKFLFTGDAGILAFDKIRHDLKEVYWLKVPHHGSIKNLDGDLVERLRPKVAFISADGSSHHPDSSLLACLEKHQVKVRSTNSEGNITIEV
ncbi:MAG: MBL fold metallo-hydrolase [Candidatus Omnitrophica bacterium]|nr:MBL fold metallo-hydrolase [Candidatus Omnitrophota bacterium]MDD5690481.1 MBL fold metallo-hydrolase [Candidatus Omnitrophota bacterium]